MLWIDAILLASVARDLEPLPSVRESCDLDWALLKNVGVRVNDDRALSFATGLVRCNLKGVVDYFFASDISTADDWNRCLIGGALTAMADYDGGRLLLSRIDEEVPDAFLQMYDVEIRRCGRAPTRPPIDSSTIAEHLASP